MRRIRKASGEFFKRNQGYWSRAVDAARSPRLIRAFNAQEYEFQRFSEEGTRRRSTMLRYRLLQLFTGPLGELFGATALAAGIWFGDSTLGGDVSLATIGSSAATLVWLLGSLRALFNALSPLETTLVMQRRLRKLWDSGEEPMIETVTPSLAGEFTAEGLTFAYDEEVFRDVSFSLHPGELVHLGGQSGVGKTTLARVLCRLYEPDSGRLLLDGKPLSDYSLADWRSRARLVSQEPEFMPGNLLETVAYPEQPDLEKSRRLLALVQLDNLDAERLLSSGALELSGGERRRLALARALYRKPDLLILDEATSFVDEALEEELIGRLRREYPQLMILLISHRRAAAHLADRRLLLSHRGVQSVSQG
ncbi:ABC transporter ATP-binding protein/permease [bacterium]|nr:ABC transporter ATP-binding protein/permease [bacterium]